MIKFLRTQSALLFTLGIVPILEMLFTVEWVDASCQQGGDGPIYLATGFPFPYEIYSGVSSLEFYFMPHIYFLNLIIVSAIFYFTLRKIFQRFTRQIGRFELVLSGIGVLLFLFCMGIKILLVSGQGLIAVQSIASTPNGNYFDLRPVSVAWNRGDNECKL